MSDHSLHSSAPILLVGGGPATIEAVQWAFARAGAVVAADGGYYNAKAAGVPVQAILGDGDSLDPKDVEGVAFTPSKDQDSTDFEKCLAAVSAPVILAVGFLGGRLDHQLAAFSAILKDPRPVILMNEVEMAFVLPQQFSCDVALGTPISFYPLVPLTATTAGVAYPLTNCPMASDGQISTSNTVTGQVQVTTDRRGLLCSLPRDAFAQVRASLHPSASSSPPAAPPQSR